MWVAKPIRSLSNEEQEVWLQIEAHAPLSQTLGWARAIESVSGQAYLVFSPDEKVGGIVFSTPVPSSNQMHFECVNGPLLNWDHPHSAPRQMATFAVAVSKLGPGFLSLSMKPRWENENTNPRLKHLPIPPTAQSQASTVVVPIQDNKDDQFRLLSSRMRRSLSIAQRNQIETSWEKVTPQLLNQFVPAMKQFGESKGFTVPPKVWFETLTCQTTRNPSPSYWIASSRKTENQTEVSRTQLLICFMNQKAYYLFGYETRNPGLRASVSTAVAAHWETLQRCIASGIRFYDLNGYMIDAAPSHPYYGVCRFKDQFSGSIVRYDIPEFLIQ